MSSIVFSRVLEMLLFPPGICILLLVIAMLPFYKKPKTPQRIRIAGVAILYISSIPLVATPLLQSLESFPALNSDKLLGYQAGAIVIQDGGHYPDAPEYSSDTVSMNTLVRVRYGAWLHRQTGLPVLVTGGTVGFDKASGARLMKQVLEKDYKIPVRWLEERSATTRENAILSKKILEEKGIKRIFLVTQAWHMRRAVQSFEQVGVDVIPAPTSFTKLSFLDRGILAFLPRSSSLSNTNRALHEYFGQLWYKISH